MAAELTLQQDVNSTTKSELHEKTAELESLRTRFSGIVDADKAGIEIVAQAHATATAIISDAQDIYDKKIAECLKIKENLISEQNKISEGNIELLSDKQSIINETNALRKQYTDKKYIYDHLLEEVAIFDERLAFAELGVYEPHFDFTDSEEFKAEIEEIREIQKRFISAKRAATCGTNWTVDGSKSKGETLTNRNLKMTLRAFNSECDAAISNTRWNNVNAMMKRIIYAREQIDKLNKSSNITITNEYFESRMMELRLTHEYREKLKEERDVRLEASRAEREEKRFLQDMLEAEKEEAKYQKLLDKAILEARGSQGAQLDSYAENIKILEKALADAHTKVTRAQAMAEMTKSGWIYIISNIGSFGPEVIKIGLTRRLDPLDRVRELGSASVPFTFDVHAIIYSDSAPTLERALHNEFDQYRVNAKNSRKEFFRVPLTEVEKAVKALAPESTFFQDIEAQEFQETLALRNARLQVETHNPIKYFPASI
ncbi:DUF4041 domain-containing protein [Pseudomonas sp. C2L12B]|nr:DUF4041 domain-containing protein [Pseudomonas typographi]